MGNKYNNVLHAINSQMKNSWRGVQYVKTAQTILHFCHYCTALVLGEQCLQRQ